MTKRYEMLVMTNAAGNNNKFYEMKLEDNDEVVIRYGRVGANGVTESKGYGESTFEKVKSSKTKKGYRSVDVVLNEGGKVSSRHKMTLAEIAKRDIAGNNPALNALLDRLAQINRFQLLSASGGQIDIVDGEVKTALGVLISLDSIQKAKDDLQLLSEYVGKNDFSESYVNTLQDYLTKIPQKVSHRRGWDRSFFTEITTVQNQYDLLDQLENSVKNSQTVEVSDGVEQEEIGCIFDYSLQVVEDDAEFDRINKFYTSTLDNRHSASSKKLVRLYKLINEDQSEKYASKLAKIGNEMDLWHGSRVCNILSIMKSGIIIPPTVGGGYTIAGRMFGDYRYMSNISSKALNYAGGYWGKDGMDNGSIFMFKTKAAMGKYYVPSGSCQKIPTGYDSMYAMAGKSGVLNNEMMIPDDDQYILDYLCEFE